MFAKIFGKHSFIRIFFFDGFKHFSVLHFFLHLIISSSLIEESDLSNNNDELKIACDFTIALLLI